MHKKFLIAPFIAMMVLSMIFISTQIPMTKMAPIVPQQEKAV